MSCEDCELVRRSKRDYHEDKEKQKNKDKRDDQKGKKVHDQIMPSAMLQRKDVTTNTTMLQRKDVPTDNEDLLEEKSEMKEAHWRQKC